jgi:hypothetical protein
MSHTTTRVVSADAALLSESDEAADPFFTPESAAPATPARPVVDPARRRALRRYVATALAVASVICVAA